MDYTWSPWHPLGPESRNTPRPHARRRALRDSGPGGCEGD